MRAFLAKIAALMRSMGSFTTRLVKVAGKWVSQLVHVLAAPTPEPIAEPESPSDQVEDFAALRRVAGLLAMGDVPKPADLEAVPGKAVDWLRAQDKQALIRIMSAQPDQIVAHMRGRAMIRGVVPYEDEAIRDVTAARAAPAVRPTGRTRREALAEMGMAMTA